MRSRVMVPGRRRLVDMTTTHSQSMQSLADKLNGLDLTSEEDDILAVLIAGHGEEAEVQGFGDLAEVRVRDFSIGMPAQSSAAHELREHVTFCYQKITWT